LLFISIGGGGDCLWTTVTNGPVVHPPGDIEAYMSVESHRGVILTGETEEIEENKHVPVPLRPPQITHELTRREPGPSRWEDGN
jgi:hypothetical protein